MPESELLNLDSLRAHQMFFSGVASMAVVLHVALFVLRSRLRENLACAFFALSFGLMIYSNFEAGLVTSPGREKLVVHLFTVSVAASCFAWLLTLHAVLAIGRSRVLAIFGAFATLSTIGALAWPSPLSNLGMMTVVVLAVAVAGWWIIAAWRQRHPGAPILGTGMILLAACISLNLMRTVGFGLDRHEAIYLPAYGGIFALVSLSLLVARNYTLVSRRLEEKLVEVETLSRAAIAQEQEKQRFIAAKNVELEEQVTVRTAELREEKGKADALLYNILPREAADELKATGRATSRRFEDVTVIFTDFKGFTNTVSAMPAQRLITELNEIFNQFDDIIDRHGLTKIKTIGDAYMAAGGLPDPADDAAIRAIDAARDIVAFIHTRNRDAAVKWHIRIGVHTGIVVAGVVGKRRLIYDIFGDTVNIASRLESQGAPGRINLSAYTYELVRSRHACEYRGKVDLKGKGEIDMYYVANDPNTLQVSSGSTPPAEA